MWHLGSVCCSVYLEHLEEGQQVLYIGTVAQGSAGGLVRQPVEVLGCAQDGSGSGGQQAQQLPLTAPLHGLEPCQSPHCTCSTLKQINSADRHNCLEHNLIEPGTRTAASQEARVDSGEFP